MGVAPRVIGEIILSKKKKLGEIIMYNGKSLPSSHTRCEMGWVRMGPPHETGFRAELEYHIEAT